MFARASTVLILILLFGALGQARIGHAAPRACSSKEGGLLKDGEPGVLLQHGKLTPSAAEFETYSLAQLNPMSGADQNEMCLRYEFKNASEQTIKFLRWPDIAVPIHTIPIKPGEQSAWTNPQHDVLDKPGVHRTRLEAFDNDIGISQVYFAEVRQPVRGLRKASKTPLTEFDVIRAAPTLAQQLIAQGYPVKPVRAFQVPLKEPVVQYAELTREFSAQDISVVFASSAEFAQGIFRITWTIETSRRVSVGAPMLFALIELKPPANLEGLQILAKALPSFVGEGNVSKFFEKTLTYNPSNSFAKDTFFIVHHPLTIRTETGISCMIARTYSPLPLSAGANHC